MAASEKIPDALKTVAEGLAHTLTCQAIVIFSQTNKELYYWRGNWQTVWRLQQWANAAGSLREPGGRLETGDGIADMAGVSYVAACPVRTPQGSQEFVVAVAGGERAMAETG